MNTNEVYSSRLLLNTSNILSHKQCLS